MIPKIIHFCWLSGEQYPYLVEKCIKSWRDNLPDYEIMCWDLKRFDINCCRYTKEAFLEKKYAFASDYIRLYALYHFGGIYLDSDIEVLKSFDDLLNLKAFTCFHKMSMTLSPWIIGSEKGNKIIKEFLDYYEERSFYNENGVSAIMIHTKKGKKLFGMANELTGYPVNYEVIRKNNPRIDTCEKENVKRALFSKIFTNRKLNEACIRTRGIRKSLRNFLQR